MVLVTCVQHSVLKFFTVQALLEKFINIGIERVGGSGEGGEEERGKKSEQEGEG